MVVVLFPGGMPLLSKKAMVLIAQSEDGSKQNVMPIFVTNLKTRKQNKTKKCCVWKWNAAETTSIIQSLSLRTKL